MVWFKKKRYTILNPKESIEIEDKTPELKDIWFNCKKCSFTCDKNTAEKNLYVCPKCFRHSRISAKYRIDITIDEGTFKETDADLLSADPLNFQGVKPYKQAYDQAREKTKINDAIITGKGLIKGIKAYIGAMDFYFMGGSMGSVVGEKIYRLFKNAMAEKIPVILFCASGGARMHEGIFSLMQMAKTCAIISEYKKQRNLFINVFCDPTTGGVTASFAAVADLCIAEPGALIGFAGPRVIEQTIKQKLPSHFQTSEFLLKKGFIDLIVNRNEMKDRLFDLLRFFTE